MRTEAQHVLDRWVDLAERAGAAGGDHGVVGALPAQRPVTEFGRQCGIPAGQPPFGQQSRQEQVRVRVALPRGAEHIESHPADRVHRPPAGTGSPRPGSGPRALSCPRAGTGLAAGAGALGPARAGCGMARHVS